VREDALSGKRCVGQAAHLGRAPLPWVLQRIAVASVEAGIAAGFHGRHHFFALKIGVR